MSRVFKRAVGASETFTHTTLALAGQHANLVTVTTDRGVTDPGHYFGEMLLCFLVLGVVLFFVILEITVCV